MIGAFTVGSPAFLKTIRRIYVDSDWRLNGEPPQRALNAHKVLY